MSDAYQQVLEATVQELERLKRNGVRFVAVAPETLAALKTKPVATTPAATSPSATRRTAPASPAPAAHSRPAPAPAAPVVPARLETAPAAASAPTAPPLSPEDKVAAFADLQQRVLGCVKCKNLVDSRKNVVFGVGNIHADVMFVGEAPGADEDAQGEPFVGAAGQLLTKIIQTMGLSRETVYIANILKCRPDMPPHTSGNRKPTPEEMRTCIPFLQEQIDLIRPKVIVALGATAMEGLLGKAIYITKARGQWHTYRGIPLMPTYHPAYLLRNQALAEKRRVWEDMLKVMEKLALPISEKQRNYFLR
jgi:DNA polymerase